MGVKRKNRRLIRMMMTTTTTTTTTTMMMMMMLMMIMCGLMPWDVGLKYLLLGTNCNKLLKLKSNRGWGWDRFTFSTCNHVQGAARRLLFIKHYSLGSKRPPFCLTFQSTFQQSVLIGPQSAPRAFCSRFPRVTSCNIEHVTSCYMGTRNIEHVTSCNIETRNIVQQRTRNIE